MWRPIATIAAAARDVELEEPVLKLSWYSIYINLVLNIFIFLGGGPTLIEDPEELRRHVHCRGSVAAGAGTGTDCYYR